MGNQIHSTPLLHIAVNPGSVNQPNQDRLLDHSNYFYLEFYSQILSEGFAKSYWPEANLEPLVSGMPTDCIEDKFKELVEEVKPVA
jgi:hypothetical protein